MPIKFRVINGGRKQLEDKVMRDMSEGRICPNDLDKLKPWGELTLVKQTDPLPAEGSDCSKKQDSLFGS